MDKPTFVYVPDLKSVKMKLPRYHLENIKKYPHLIWCETISDVKSNIERHLMGDNKTVFDFRHLFKYHDMNNTTRVLEWMFDKYGINKGV